MERSRALHVPFAQHEASAGKTSGLFEEAGRTAILKGRVDEDGIMPERFLKDWGTRAEGTAGISIPPDIQRMQDTSHQQGHSLILVAVDTEVAGAIELQPTVWSEAKAVIQGLTQRGITATYIISGDHEAPTRKLAEEVALLSSQPGVYDVVWGTTRVRVIVLSEIPTAAHNAVWHLFSGVQEQVAYGATQYQTRTPTTSTLLNQLFETYRVEGLEMPYTMEDFKRDYIREHLHVLTAEEILQNFSKEELLQGFSKEELKEYLAKREQSQAAPKSSKQ